MITQRKGLAKHIALSLTSGMVWFAISFIGLNMLLASWMVGYAFRQCIDGNFGIGLPYGLMLGLFVTVPGAAIAGVFAVWRFPPLPMRCICIGLGTMAIGIVISIDPLASACLGFIAIVISLLSRRQIYVGMCATLVSFSLTFAGGYLTAFVSAKPRHCTHSYAHSIPTQRLDAWTFSANYRSKGEEAKIRQLDSSLKD